MRYTFFILLTLPSVWTNGQSLSIGKWTEILRIPFNLKDPVLLDFTASKTFSAKLSKALLKANLGRLTVIKVNANNSIENPQDYKFRPFVSKIETIEEMNLAMEVIDKNDCGTIAIVLLIVKNEIFVSRASNVRLNQQVFLLDLESLELSETYHLNGKTFTNKVGHYRIRPSLPSMTVLDFHFVDFDKWSMHVGKRRSNLCGKHLVIMTAHDPPYTILSDGYRDIAPYHSDNETYDVTDLTFGFYYEVLTSMANEANFSFSIYARKEGGGFGTVKNGTTPTRTLINIVDGSADMIVGALGISLIRKPVLNYIGVVSTNLPSIFIKNFEEESIYLMTFVMPFSTDLWIAITVIALSIATWLFLSNFNPDDEVG